MSVSMFARWLFEDRATGKIVVAQMPNLALWVFIAAVVVQSTLRPSGTPGAVVAFVRLAALAVWAVDEIVRGVNPWRRILGGLVLGGTAAAWLNT